MPYIDAPTYAERTRTVAERVRMQMHPEFFPRQSASSLRLSARQCTALTKALFRSYGCFFAEFLGDLSLVRLTLLELTTCVGLRYGSCVIMLRKFSWKRALYNSLWRIAGFCDFLVFTFKWVCGFTYTTTSKPQLKSNNKLYILHSVIPSHFVKVREY